MNIDKIKELYNEAEYRLKNYNIGCFEGMDKPLILISDTYPGIWLEHAYDSVMYAYLYPEETEYMMNTLNLFIDNQSVNGQLPCFVINPAKAGNRECLIGYSHIQECVSFSSLCLKAFDITKDVTFLQKSYLACVKWVKWLEENRMTQNTGLIEMFVGYDTGHDNSGRLNGMKYIGCYKIDDKPQNASVFPYDDEILPIYAVDMNCNYYGNLISLSEMARILKKTEESAMWIKQAEKVKTKLIEICYDREESFFYDTDKSFNKRKVKSSSILHLFLEKVLDKEKDKEVIDVIYNEHIKNKDEFWTDFPIPSVALNDLTAKIHTRSNSWGYYSQALIALRLSLWMDDYGKNDDFNFILKKWVEALSEHSDILKFGQELDPITGIPSDCSEWYSSCMLLFIYAVRRLKLID